MHFVIIGNGVAGITAAFTLRQRDPQSRITVISAESDYFFSRTALMYAFMDRMTRRDMEPFERPIFDKQRIERVRARVIGLDAEAHTLQLDDGREIRYDRLLLATGSVPNPAPWNDIPNAGVVSFVSLQDLEECERLVPSTKRAVVAGGGLIGVELVECLAHHGIEVEFLVRENWYWPMALAEEEGAIIADHIRRHGVQLHLGQEIAEIGSGADGRVSEVRTRQGQRFPCQMFGICIGVRPGIAWLRDVQTPPALGHGIQVTADFQTSLPDVWAAGDCAEFRKPDGAPLVEQIWYSAKRQGALAAAAMLGDAVEYVPPLFYNSAKLFEIEYTTVGASGENSFFHRVPGRDISIRIMHTANAVTGMNMLGSRWDHSWFERWIHERRSPEFVMASLHLAQFDVEFGRLPLEGVRAAFGAAS